MQYRIQHITSYHYPQKADLGPHTVRLRPAVHAKCKLLNYSLSVEPDCQVRWQYDPWNNLIARLAFSADKKIDELKLCVDATVEVKPTNPFDFYVESWCETLPFDYPDAVKKELLPFLEKPVLGPLLSEFIHQFPLEGLLVDFLVNLNSRVFEHLKYEVREEPGIQTSEETLARRAGSCRDTAQIIMDILRLKGLAARFVSGYLLQEVEDESLQKPEMKLDLHAWTEVYVPGAGWIGLDGTSGLLCSEGHIPLACTVTPEQAAPVFGTASEAADRFDYSSNVSLIGADFDHGQPYSDDSYREILKCGDTVDALLASHDLLLTSGGEPTFTAIENGLCANGNSDADSGMRVTERPEWFTEALGESKWSKSMSLFSKVFDQFGEGPLPIVGTGKLYPGESMPRWSMTLLWRVDGEPIWLNRDLLSFSDQLDQLNLSGQPRVEKQSDTSDDSGRFVQAEEFLKELSKNLNVQPNIIPGYEDPVQLVVSEGNLPLEEELSEISSQSDLDDQDERKRLARVLDQGAGSPVGLCLPMAKLEDKWYSQVWKFKRERMFLVPGQSPMGLRLPLDRIRSDLEFEFDRDPSTASGDLPGRGSQRSTYGGDRISRTKTAKSPDESQNDISESNKESTEEREDNSRAPVTALCVERRGGFLGVFLPPMPSVDDFLELIEAIEEAAVVTSCRVRIEGYAPPPDPRIRSLSLTPDPGVLEVNMPVAETLRQYARNLELVAKSAENCALGTEKYQLDGRVVGTGGGHHITLGGPTTLKSPFIEQPHILASMVRYFQNHPSLSFFFTGLFVGPHSQAPRIDEARLESLYELELALSQFPGPGEEAAPWLTDRLLRNILVDMTGNTHRAEICIDKLYNPESPTGRLGLVELRAFEMPRHYQMAVAQVLLVRALICRFVLDPYREKLISWSETLHDKYMLPHYLMQDLDDVLKDLSEHGMRFSREWFLPFREFRFPVLGTLHKEEVYLELRVAHEPWHVLSVVEEGSTVSRPVDSSMERIQVKVSNLNPERQKIIVNGVELPLAQTSVSGEFVGAVRFRAWQPPNCMHPNIEVHHPLKFEIIDTRERRSIGACEYHVIHPEGKLYEEPPLTRHDASARVNRRFVEGNHTPWPVEYIATGDSGMLTLDLRLHQKVHEC